MISNALCPPDAAAVAQKENSRASFVTLFSTVMMVCMGPPGGGRGAAVSFLVSVEGRGQQNVTSSSIDHYVSKKKFKLYWLGIFCWFEIAEKKLS